VGGRRELFVDRHLIDRLHDASLLLHTPVEKETVLTLDRPWEGAFSGYFTIIKDGPRFLLFYRCLPVSGADGRIDESTCLAESTDGIRFSRPADNFILKQQPPFSHNFAPFLDTNPRSLPQQRFKALAGTSKSGLAGFASPDGVRWTNMRDEPVLPPAKETRYDSQNVAFWSEHEGRYVCYFRTFKNKVRWVSRTTSPDFLNWAEPVEMSFGDAPPEHIYVNQTSPYFRAPHIYISLAARFMPGRQVLTPDEAAAVRVDPKYFQDCSDAVFFSTRGGDLFDRTFLESFLRPGTGLENWVSRSNYPANNVVQTGPAEMSFYVNRNYGQPTAHLKRYALRLDGFVSVHAGYKPGELLTKPFRFNGRQLEINYSTSAAGSIRIQIQDLDGKVLEESREIIGDQIERTVSWKSGSDLARLSGTAVQLRVVLRDADLYSFRFR
jgi:hypothetical protein